MTRKYYDPVAVYEEKIWGQNLQSEGKKSTFQKSAPDNFSQDYWEMELKMTSNLRYISSWASWVYAQSVCGEYEFPKHSYLKWAQMKLYNRPFMQEAGRAFVC